VSRQVFDHESTNGKLSTIRRATAAAKEEKTASVADRTPDRATVCVMMHPARETDARLHHLISRGYMLRFSPDGERVHIFDQITGKFRFSKPKNVAAQIEFYTMKTKDGESRRWIESRLGEVDAAVGIFDKLERGEEITREERFRVAVFAGFADSRGTGFRSMTPPLSARHNPEDDEEFLPRFAEVLSAMTRVMSLISRRGSTRTAS
jgi:hypothetical protein